MVTRQPTDPTWGIFWIFQWIFHTSLADVIWFRMFLNCFFGRIWENLNQNPLLFWSNNVQNIKRMVKSMVFHRYVPQSDPMLIITTLAHFWSKTLQKTCISIVYIHDELPVACVDLFHQNQTLWPIWQWNPLDFVGYSIHVHTFQNYLCLCVSKACQTLFLLMQALIFDALSVLNKFVEQSTLDIFGTLPSSKLTVGLDILSIEDSEPGPHLSVQQWVCSAIHHHPSQKFTFPIIPYLSKRHRHRQVR